METEEQTFEREQNESIVLDAGGDDKCPAGMSDVAENVSVVVNIKTRKG